MTHCDFNEDCLMLEEIKKIILTKTGNINSKRNYAWLVNNGHGDLYDNIMSTFSEYSDFRNKVLAILNGDYCRCATCNNIMKFHYNKTKIQYCSPSCGNNSHKKKSGRKISKEEKDKRKSTSMKRYGAECFLASEYGKSRIKNTLIEKYGVNNSYKIPEIYNKRYSESTTQSRAASIIKYKAQYIESLGIKIPDSVELKDISIGRRGKEYSKELIEILLGISPPNIEVIRTNRINAYPLLHKYGLMDSGVASWQLEIQSWLTKIGINYIQNDRTKLAPKEIDILIPEYNIGIECNGVFWHSYPNKLDKNYHINKTNDAIAVGINLLQFWDYEWKESKNIVKSIISAKLGIIDNKIYARCCDVRLVSTQAARKFFNHTHLYGFSPASYYIGLFYKDELVMCASFMKSMFDKTYSWEVIRVSSKLNTVVVGGISKILKYFTDNNSGSIISYADRRISDGNSYTKCGFINVGTTSPNYFYYKNNKKVSKYQLQHEFNMTEDENMMMSAGWLKCYDCGSLKFVLDKYSKERI